MYVIFLFFSYSIQRSLQTHQYFAFSFIPTTMGRKIRKCARNPGRNFKIRIITRFMNIRFSTPFPTLCGKTPALSTLLHGEIGVHFPYHFVILLIHPLDTVFKEIIVHAVGDQENK